MKIHTVERVSFPQFPRYEGSWAAFYYEPIPTSGERLTVAVGAWDVDGSSFTETVPLGILPYQLSFMIETAVAVVRRQLEELGIDGVSMPGIYAGPVRTGMGNDREDVLRQGVSLTSSIARGLAVHVTTDCIGFDQQV